MTRPPVTDRAVVEYLAQVWGVDVAGLRSRIAREAQAGLSGAGLAQGAVAVNRGRAKFVIHDATVVAVAHRAALPTPGPFRSPSGAGKARRDA